MSDPTRTSFNDDPAHVLVQQEVKRLLDRKAVPSVRDVLDDIRFFTQLELVRVSGDAEVPGQSEILEVRYGLIVDSGGLPEEHDALWNRLTDVFYSMIPMGASLT